MIELNHWIDCSTSLRDQNSAYKCLSCGQEFYKDDADLYEQHGEKAKAIEHCEKFLSLWKDADLGLPEVADAREMVAGLKCQQEAFE